MFPLVETIKIQNGIPLHLQWHQRRMDYAFHMLHGTSDPFQLDEILSVDEEYRMGAVKCRFLYNHKSFETEFSEYKPRDVKTLKLSVSDSIDYSHKYTNRKMINDLLEMKGEADDILIVRDGQITDTSYSNIVFYDGETWLTPSDPLLEGTARNRLLAQGKIYQTRIRVEDLNRFFFFRLINAMLDFEKQNDIGIASIIH